MSQIQCTTILRQIHGAKKGCGQKSFYNIRPWLSMTFL